ncbi:uncharacterized protein LOC110454236 [Mizuhopecten yessoensis]|uniref:Sushi domain-containing protein n=1 Tax=Mizuhopecten yessoensis TaxID=6573 RepID=A0A210R4D5_MIZYE|nr:uncharacterized protein LOC110454236 [Mizuhopecten yessoensis]OWF55852.1 hypothetical protein KP79_PYT11632 [Mizuhopecten yessoensis]
MACPAYPSVAAATATLVNSTTVKYACISGYSMQGDTAVHCTGGVWQSTLPQCLIVYENHEVSNTINVYETIEPSEIPQWLLYIMAGSAGMAGLSFLVGLLLCCLHLLGCYSGPIVGFGGNHVYPKKQCCNCAYCCCCCCRCCKKCCTGPDDDDDEEDDEEQIGLPMLEKKDLPTKGEKDPNDQPPEDENTVNDGAKGGAKGRSKGRAKAGADDGPVVDKKNSFPPGNNKNADM